MPLSTDRRNKPRDAALIRWIVSGFGGPAVAPLVAVALLALSSIQFAAAPAWVAVLLFFAFAACWGLMLLDRNRL
ncbi:hypothetical protein [Mesorhizobium sp.]|uniref:hypothetical protein n=1 Tax=Mesorhizobium sp. TaxID=1871066 RepID=UPI000FE609A1|nr:hypothetical protein [Mesorhizobium sp.]RWI35399.1 MAG: hypothetical protein EOR14_28255 [Mesorhizobium sp.]RWJ66432.1 MAG: hypothetical protein EOR34_28880 [Mesorhizobium sp.]